MVGGVADGFIPVQERDFGGHVYQEKLHWFSAFSLGKVWRTGVKFSSIQNVT